jgi:hypothetical protein
MEFNLKKFKLYCFNIEYNKYNDLLNRLQTHVQSLYNKNIININERNLRLSDIYKIISNLNNITYNNNDDNQNEINIFDDLITKLKILNINYNSIYEYLCSLYKLPNNILCINNYNKLVNNNILFPLNSINQYIIEFAKNIGLKKLNDIFIIYKLNNSLSINDKELFDLYNNIFIPLHINIIDYKSSKSYFKVFKTTGNQ